MKTEKDTLLPPRKRYCLALFKSFESDGFHYLKSKNTFVRQFEYGQQRLRFQFVSTMGFIHSVGFHLNISFDQMEKEFKVPFERKSKKTFGFNLSYLNDPLYDEETGEYSDSSIAKASEQYLKEVHLKMLGICERFNTYQKVFNLILESPTEIIYGSSEADGMRIGLFLSRYLDPNKSTHIKNYFENYCTEILHPTVQESTRQKFKKIYEFVERYELNKTMLKILGC